MNKAKQITDETPGAHMLQQFENSANAEIHALTTGTAFCCPHKLITLLLEGFESCCLQF